MMTHMGHIRRNEPRDGLISSWQLARILGSTRRTIARDVAKEKVKPAGWNNGHRFDLAEVRRIVDAKANEDAEWLYRARVEIDRIAPTLSVPLPGVLDEEEKPGGRPRRVANVA